MQQVLMHLEKQIDAYVGARTLNGCEACLWTHHKAVTTVKEIFPEKSRVLYDCAIYEKETGEQTIAS